MLFAARRERPILRLLGEKATKFDLKLCYTDLRTDLVALSTPFDDRVSSLKLDVSSVNGRLNKADTQIRALPDVPSSRIRSGALPAEGNRVPSDSDSVQSPVDPRSGAVHCICVSSFTGRSRASP
jgi:hypothetical protein